LTEDILGSSFPVSKRSFPEFQYQRENKNWFGEKQTLGYLTCLEADALSH
jgi:hypothetical protein